MSNLLKQLIIFSLFRFKKLKFLYFLAGIILFSNSVSKAQGTNPWKYFDLEYLVEKNTDTDSPYFRFLDESSFSAGLYELPAGSEDHQNPHVLDEIYYVIKGKATLVMGNDSKEVEPGVIAYVKANVPHHFKNIEEDLQVLVIFSKTPSATEGINWQTTHIDELIEKRDPNKNVWNQFLDVQTMAFGLYMLPKQLGGDDPLTHKVDEINIVVNGSSTFFVGDKNFEAKPGSIFFVESGNPHHFEQINSDEINILILFHKKPGKQ